MLGPQGIFDLGHRFTHLALIAIAFMIFQMWEKSRAPQATLLPPMPPQPQPPALPPVFQQPPPAIMQAQHTPVPSSMSTPIASL
jgi:hypothetical protein